MENVDPLGIHTGESIVVAPSQTLTNTGEIYLWCWRLIGMTVIGLRLLFLVLLI